MRLQDLEARFLKRIDSHNFGTAASLEDADGVLFLCPKCFAANGGPSGTHSVICWSPSVPQDTHPIPGRWELHGTSVDDLTLVAGSSSVLLTGGCAAHFYVRDGAIVDC